MKKVLFVLLAVVIVASTLVVSTAAAEIPTDGLIGYFKFEGNLNNEAAADTPGVLMGKTFGESMYDDPSELFWVHNSVEGYGFDCAEGDGFCTYVNPGDNDFTVAVWLLEISDPGIIPYVWYGQTSQSPENWIGIWNVNVAAGWTRTPGITIGSNDAAGARIEIVPAENNYDADAAADGGIIMQWTHIAYTATQVKGEDEATADTYTITMYVNGVEVGTNSGFPDPYTGDPETNGDWIYVNGVNAWPDYMSTGGMDDLVIYNRALSADEIAAIYGSYAAPKQYANYDEFAADCDVVAAEGEGKETEAPETEAPETEAPETEAPETEAPKGDDTTAAPEEKGGCGSAMGAAAAIVALTSVLGCAIIKKH